MQNTLQSIDHQLTQLIRLLYLHLIIFLPDEPVWLISLNIPATGSIVLSMQLVLTGDM